MNDENDDDNDQSENGDQSWIFKNKNIIIFVMIVILLVIGIIFLIKHFKDKNTDTNLTKSSHNTSSAEETTQKSEES